MARASLHFCCIIFICEFGFGLSNDVWCLQCTWDTSNVYDSNSTNAIAGTECIIDDLDDITKYPPDSPTPIANPVCMYDNTAQDYENLLSGTCYDNACYAIGAMVCAKWTEYKNDKLMKITRMCAIPGGIESGCYHQSYGEDQYKEVCFCEDQDFCNAAQILHCNVLSFTTLLLITGIQPVVRWLI